jgi:GalNAc5-diNAcBac-PP-undecaprenol beta-1,3-glucosyltransferase
MDELPLSIVITTYNREDELRRCINSILKQNYSNYEIIVVDDHSPNSYEMEITRDFPHVRYYYQPENKGPGAARNRGIKEAIHNYIVIMDDDDVFTSNAFEKIGEFILSQRKIESPVIHFLCSSTTLNEDFKFTKYSFEQYVSGSVKGDTTHVINKELFLENKYAFPNSKIGAELLLWYQIAIDFGYLIVNEVVVEVLTDSSERLTNFNRQVINANLFANYQEEILSKFKNHLLEIGRKDIVISKYRGAITYYLIEGNRTFAAKNLFNSLKYSWAQLLFFPLLLLPKSIVTKLFLKYRG